MIIIGIVEIYILHYELPQLSSYKLFIDFDKIKSLAT